MTHIHDWRVDPRVLLASYPPKRRIVCAECGEERFESVAPPTASATDDPRTWPQIHVYGGVLKTAPTGRRTEIQTETRA